MSLTRLDAELAGRASAVLDEIRRQANGEPPGDVITRLKSLPSLLRTSGLPATMAFLYAKAGSDGSLERAYLTVRNAMVRELARAWGWDDEPGALEFFARIGDPQKIDATDLAMAAARLEEFANWMRRLAEAMEKAAPRPPADATHRGPDLLAGADNG